MTQQSLAHRAGWQSYHPLDRPIVPPIPGTWLATALLLSSTTVAVMIAHAGMKIPIANVGCAAVTASIAALAVVRCTVRKPVTRLHVRVRDFSESVLLFLWICLLGVIASYPAAAATTGFVDPALANMDRLLHFNWVSWYLAVADHPYLRSASATAYASIFVSPVILLGYFAWTHRRFEARKFLATFWLAAVLTLVLFFRFPAEGPLAFLWHGPIPYMPTSALYQEQLIPELRAHQLTAINLGALRGLVCAPSFHTVSGVLYMAAAWPIARLRWPLIALNTAMLLATPIEGTHYLTDMLAGLIVAIVATIAVAAVLRVHTQKHTQ